MAELRTPLVLTRCAANFFPPVLVDEVPFTFARFDPMMAYLGPQPARSAVQLSGEPSGERAAASGQRSAKAVSLQQRDSVRVKGVRLALK